VTVVRHNDHVSVRLVFRGGEPKPWQVVDVAGQSTLARFERKRDALGEYRAICRGLHAGLRPLPLFA